MSADRFIMPGGPGFVYVPARVCALLEADLASARRGWRERDLDVSDVLQAMHAMAMQWKTDRPLVPTSELGRPAAGVSSCSWWSSSEAADFLGVTEHRVCELARDRRLVSRKVRGRWELSVDDVKEYRDGGRSSRCS